MIARSNADDIAYFISFCIEIYKHARKVSGEIASRIFSECGMIEYLADNYEVLHTQSPSWILAEVEDYIKEKLQ
ncbi:MAG: DUF3791 domain-containing protein [Muribaculum sp.]|nr:DUF3791 domain-containing protein [Muribaculum sp.]